jgi:5-methylcytosine-specific restriction endonuclease McrA
MPGVLGSPSPTQGNASSTSERGNGVLRCRVLLLNSSYEPMKVLSWQKALILWFQDKVEVIEYSKAFARSSLSSFQIPSVIRLKRYIKPRHYSHVRFCRENVYIRDRHTCQYCSEKLHPKLLTLDHVVPVSKNGPTTWTNVVTACRSCNQRKGNRTPAVAQMPLLKNPVMPAWLPSLEFQKENSEWPGDWVQYLELASS